jgi:hypothetical protein
MSRRKFCRKVLDDNTRITKLLKIIQSVVKDAAACSEPGMMRIDPAFQQGKYAVAAFCRPLDCNGGKLLSSAEEYKIRTISANNRACRWDTDNNNSGSDGG